MKKKPMQIAMVCLSAASMMIISLYKLNISSMVLMLAAAFIGIIVFVINNLMEGERVKK